MGQINADPKKTWYRMVPKIDREILHGSVC